MYLEKKIVFDVYLVCFVINYVKNYVLEIVLSY